MPTTATPSVITDPGYLFWAPLGSTLPSNTVVGSKFTDAWPGAWLSNGATENGSEFDYSTKVEAVEAAEFLDPIKWATTGRQGTLAFNMLNFALTNWNRAVNGGALTVVSGTGTTQLTSLTPPVPGAETRAMLGWEATTNDFRIVMYQCINSGDIKAAFAKAPKEAVIPCTFNFELPTSPQTPWTMFAAGTARA